MSRGQGACVRTKESTLLTPVTENIYLIQGANQGRFPFSHSLLVKGRETFLIDAGCGRDQLLEIRERFAPDRVILSHVHPDHCSGAAMFSTNALWVPVEAGMDAGKLNALARRFVSLEIQTDWLQYMREEVGFEDFQPGHLFHDQEIFDAGSTIMQTIRCQGHTLDHYCFYFPAEQILFTTDIDLTGFGPWYANPESDMSAFREAILRVMALPLKMVVSSHAGILREGLEREFRQFLSFFDQREQAILQFLEHPRTMDDFVDRALIYRAYPYRPVILRAFEKRMIAQHLKHLQARGEVGFLEGTYFRKPKRENGRSNNPGKEQGRNRA